MFACAGGNERAAARDQIALLLVDDSAHLVRFVRIGWPKTNRYVKQHLRLVRHGSTNPLR